MAVFGLALLAEPADYPLKRGDSLAIAVRKWATRRVDVGDPQHRLSFLFGGRRAEFTGCLSAKDEFREENRLRTQLYSAELRRLALRLSLRLVLSTAAANDPCGRGDAHDDDGRHDFAGCWG